MMARIIIWSSLVLLPTFCFAQWSQPGLKYEYDFNSTQMLTSWSFSTNSGNSFRIEIRFLPDNLTGTHSLIGTDNGSTDTGAGVFHVRTNGDEISVFHYKTSATLWSHGVITSTTANLVIGTWYHIVVDYDGTDLTVDLNGSNIISQTSADFGSSDSCDRIIIGRRGDNGTFGDSYFDGRMELIKVWDSNGMMLYYPFIDGSGTSLSNRLGGNDATITTGIGSWVNKSAPPSPPFSPSDVDSLVVWLVAGDVDGDGNSGNNSGDYSTWVDISGNGNNFTASAGDEPTYTASMLNGEAGLVFETFTDFMNSGSIPELNSNQEYTIFIVTQSNITGTGALFSLDTDENGAGGYTLYMSQSQTNVSGVLVNSAGSSETETVGFNAFSNPYIHRFVWNASDQMYVAANGTTSPNATSRDASPTVHDKFSLCSIDGVNAGAGTDIFEVLIYSTTLSAGDISDVESYLNTKYGL